MKHYPINAFLTALLVIPVAQACAGEFSSLPKEVQSQLLGGEVALLSHQPGETGKIDKRFVTVAKLMAGSRSEIWAVLSDKEDTEKFIKGVLESRIVEKKGNVIIVEQETHVGGPKGSYRYTLKYVLTPEERVDFSFVKGEIKDVAGGWWIFDGPDEKRKLVVYSLSIDPGVFAPQIVVKQGMKKTIPLTVLSIEREILRRQKLAESKENP